MVHHCLDRLFVKLCQRRHNHVQRRFFGKLLFGPEILDELVKQTKKENNLPRNTPLLLSKEKLRLQNESVYDAIIFRIKLNSQKHALSF